jgi:flagellar hook-associated protein 1
VSVGGVTVVQEGTAGTLKLETSSTATTGKTTLSVELALGAKTTLPVPVSSGSVAGLLSAVNTSIPKGQSMLNSVAAALATTVNNELKTAYTATGAPAASTPDHWQMFVGTPTASGIEVNSAMAATPSLIAVSSTDATTGRAAANNGGVAQAMAELGTTPTGPDAKYQTLVQSIGALTQSVNNQMEAQTAVAAQAKQALQGVTGVDVTTDLTSLLSFQQNYEASAKVLNTVDSAVQTLLQAV